MFINIGKSVIEVKLSFMDDGLGNVKVIPDHFTASESGLDSQQNRNSSSSRPRTDNSLRYFLCEGRKIR